MGTLAGVLGERVRRTREVLVQTARELDRLRVDNDVILRHLTSGVFTADAAGRIVYINPAAEQALGIRSADVMGRPLAEAAPGRLAALRDAMLESLRAGSGRSRVELIVASEDGRTLPLGVSTNLLTHEDTVTGVVAVFSDLTEVREMERRARRNETLAEVGALAAGIAHELRNGLTPISGSVECLQRELKLEGENATLMKLIVTECGRLHRFVTDLLNYAREREVVTEPIPMDDHLAELAETLRRDPRCAQGITVVFDPVGRAVEIEADREQIRQVWLNLAANALEAMESGGTLTLLWSEGEKSQVVVEFADTGAGIRPEDLAQVGQPFFTTKSKGTGLGLAIAQRIVERHGGTLQLESRAGRGTNVRVSLPARAMPVARAA
jgi:two-component system sensor histidine kinase HydH